MNANPSAPRQPARKSAPYSPRKAPRKCPRAPTKPVSNRYLLHQPVSPNALRLRAVVRLFKLSPTEVARAAGVSRCYVARLLSPSDDFQGSPEFYRRLEANLGRVIEGRTSQFFTVPAVSVRRVQKVMEQMPVEAAVRDALGRTA